MRVRQASISEYSESGSEYLAPSDTESEDSISNGFGSELDGATEACSETDALNFTGSKGAQAIEDHISRLASNPLELSLDDQDDEDDQDDQDERLFDGNVHPVEHYRKGMNDMDESVFDRKEYAPGTEKAIAATEMRWREFSEKVLERDPMLAYRSMSFKMVYQFLNWHLNQKTGYSGRRTSGIQSQSSLITFWCLFRLSFERATNYKIDKVIDGRRLSNALVDLGQKHKLSREKRENRSMTLADLKLQLDTTIRTTEKSFKLGEVRLLAVLYLLLLAPAGSRPASILQLRFGDIRLILARDPRNGPHKLLIKFTLNFTKRYLGKKAAKTFLIPEIIYDPSLLLSPHVFLLGILFHHRAFRSEVLNNDHQQLAALDIVQGDNELPIPLKDELSDVFIFRRPHTGPMGFSMSREPMTQGMVTEWFKRIGELVGFEHSTILYSLRYGAGNRMDRSVNVSEALRNLVMDHAPNSDTFQKHYLCRNVCVDLWAINRGDEPQQELVEQATSHGHSRSSRRPAHLTQEQAASIHENPKMVQMKQKIQKLPHRSRERAELTRERNALRYVLRRALKKEIRRQWTLDQAVQDIDYQLQHGGLPLDQQILNSHPMTPAQQRLTDALTAPLAGIDITAQFQRRAEAIDAIMAYCAVEEPLRSKVLDERVPPPPPELQRAESAGGQGLLVSDELKRSVMVQTPGERLRRCFICVSKALTLPPNNPNIKALCRTYYNAGGVTRHFRSAHLSRLGEDERLVCPLCDPAVRLKNKERLQYHADTVHGIRTDFTLP